MPIVIKEIHIRTTIEPSVQQARTGAQQIEALKKELLREVRQMLKKEMKLKNGR